MPHGTSKVDESARGKKNDMFAVGEFVAVDLRLDVGLVDAVVIQPLKKMKDYSPRRLILMCEDEEISKNLKQVKKTPEKAHTFTSISQSKCPMLQTMASFRICMKI